MSVEEFNTYHEYLLNLLNHHEELDNEDFVPEVSHFVQLVKQSMEIRKMVIKNTNWNLIIEAFPSVFKKIRQTLNVNPFFIRLLNAILLYCRIIFCVDSTNEMDLYTLEKLYETPKYIINAFCMLSNSDVREKIVERAVETLSMVAQLLPIYKLGLELDVSLGLDIDQDVQKNVTETTYFLVYSIDYMTRNIKDDIMLVIFLNNIINKNDKFLQYALRDNEFKEKVIEKYFLTKVLYEDVYNSLINRPKENVNNEENLNKKELIALQVLKKILTHESITPYFEGKLVHDVNKNFDENYEILSLWSRISSTLLCNSTIFDTFQLTNIMIWVFMILENVSMSIINIFQNHKINSIDESYIDTELIPKTDKLYDILINNLDILSHLCQFQHCQKFVLHYKGIEKLGELLGVLHTNCYRLSVHIDDKKGGKLTLNDNLKKNPDFNNWDKVIDKENNKIKSINFPHIKSLIIEILTKFLAFDNETIVELSKIKEIQNLMKAESILEVVLSNCAIDDNEPFIKERAIMFLKYALHNNQKNQEFVAKLEQRTTVDSQSETLLEEIGYEVDISKNGKIGLKKTSTSIQ
ncbi:uncharacterized protein HGUI_02564 [Hanseniaspora guilliermondii]|uniref:Ataxin-10 homolog n=1 Tax=Hanseniaspora guilliermondii TaxID=56406 RepID=A0A1L0B3L2_9ASCO|nr:uncharacterized protein HGUI_02564 [Hanseniaspora guilliermondii]